MPVPVDVLSLAHLAVVRVQVASEGVHVGGVVGVAALLGGAVALLAPEQASLEPAGRAEVELRKLGENVYLSRSQINTNLREMDIKSYNTKSERNFNNIKVFKM